jgi:hypothetical protein
VFFFSHNIGLNVEAKDLIPLSISDITSAGNALMVAVFRNSFSALMGKGHTK